MRALIGVAAIALFVIDSAANVGLSLLTDGAAMNEICMPPYIAGSNDIDRYRSGSPPPMPVATVRF